MVISRTLYSCIVLIIRIKTQSGEVDTPAIAIVTLGRVAEVVDRLRLLEFGPSSATLAAKVLSVFRDSSGSESSAQSYGGSR